LALDPCVLDLCQDGCGRETVGPPILARSLSGSVLARVPVTQPEQLIEAASPDLAAQG